jgi:acetolactate synthase-1/2/3 large subunit
MTGAPANTSLGKTVAAQIAAAFARHGVEYAFGQSIPTLFHLAAPDYGISQITYRTENAGGGMADGYARVSGRVGVVTCQNGPAAALLVAPLAEALKVSTPIVALVQDIARGTADRNAFQDLDHLALFAPVAKWVRRVDTASRVEDYVDMAFAAATSGRPGPAVLLVPVDLFGEYVEKAETGRTACLGTYPIDRTMPDPAQVVAAARLLAEAQSPLIIAGGGVHLAGAAGALAAFQERFKIPVATTVMGKGAVDETHALSLGVIGYFMGEGSRAEHLFNLVRRSDVVFLIGTRTNANGTNSWRLFPPGAKYIHLDVDSGEVGRNYESVRLVGDAKLGIEALAHALGASDQKAFGRRPQATAEEIAEAIGKYRTHAAVMRENDAEPIRPERVMLDIDSILDPDMLVVADASYASIWVANYLTSRAAGTRFISPRGLAGLGWGLPLAIGAKLASPARPVICISGDGGFAHCWAETETAVRHKLNIVHIILNNQVLGFQKDSEDVLHGAHTDACALGAVDHSVIARACGAIGVRVERAADLLPAVRTALGSDRPTVIDVITDPDARPPLTFYRGKFPRL